MIFSLLVASFAAISAAQCVEVTETVTQCTTSYTNVRPSTAIRTAHYTSTFTYNFSVTTTTQETVTVTPAATTFTDVVNVTSTITTTVVSVPPAVTVPARSGFFPLINRPNALVPAPTPTTVGRHRRGLIESRAEHLSRVKRLPKTPAGNTSGFIVLPNGDAQSLSNEFIHKVVCNVAVNINSTETTVVTATPATELLVPATATAISTSTFTVTETILEVDAQPTEYAACQSNNVVNNVMGFQNKKIYFDRIVFSDPEGFPLANTLVLDSNSPVDCCVACQNTPFCAGSFYAPSIGSCHLQLTQGAPSSSVPSLPTATLLPPFPLPSSNTSLPYPTASGAPYPAGNDTIMYLPTDTGLVPTGYSTLIPSATPISGPVEGGMTILPVPAQPSSGTIANPGPGTCSVGSMSMYVGKVYGQPEFPEDIALYVSNGPCGRMSLDFEGAEPVTPEDLKPLGPLVERRFLGGSLI